MLLTFPIFLHPLVLLPLALTPLFSLTSSSSPVFSGFCTAGASSPISPAFLGYFIFSDFPISSNSFALLILLPSLILLPPVLVPLFLLLSPTLLPFSVLLPPPVLLPSALVFPFLLSPQFFYCRYCFCYQTFCILSFFGVPLSYTTLLWDLFYYFHLPLSNAS